MDVASLEPSKELYELSGWVTDLWWHEGSEDANDQPNSYWVSPDNDMNAILPAYSLGYLLRKLPKVLPDSYYNAVWYISPGHAKDYCAGYRNPGYDGEYEEGWECEADIPEDAAAMLAIELFKQGILPKSPKEDPLQGGNRG